MRILPIVLLLTVACTGAADDTGPADTGSDTANDDRDDTGSSIPEAACINENGACVLSGNYTASMRLTADRAWLLRGGVFFGDGASAVTLEIEPGTTIYGENATNGFLVVARGARILAEGSAEAPIVFTPDLPAGARARGSWGGLILSGRAPINGCDSAPCEAEGEGGTGLYGGDVADDSSGVLKYVVIQFGGTEISTDNEINGLTLQGVGSGTVVDYVQVHRNLDDGIELFGGTVNLKHLVLSDIGDDALDWTQGYTGHIQHVLVTQAADAGNHALELDNNEDNYGATPLTRGVVSNVTIVGNPEIAEDNFAILARRGTSGQFWNFAVTGMTAGCLAVRNAETWSHFSSGSAGVAYSAFACSANFETGDDADDGGMDEAQVFDAGAGNRTVADLGIGAGYTPTTGSPLLGAGVTPTVGDGFFDAVDYIGAFDGGDDWTAGWTDWSTD